MKWMLLLLVGSGFGQQVKPNSLDTAPGLTLGTQSIDVRSRPKGNYQMGNPTGFVEVSASTGRVVKLSDAEFADLQKLRQAVAAKEVEIAKAHDIYIRKIYPCPPDCAVIPEAVIRYSDTYEFRGQFLLINVPLKK